MFIWKRERKSLMINMNFIQSIIDKTVLVDQVFQETFEHTVSRFNVKRIQQRGFLNDLQGRKNGITQILDVLLILLDVVKLVIGNFEV